MYNGLEMQIIFRIHLCFAQCHNGIYVTCYNYYNDTDVMFKFP